MQMTIKKMFENLSQHAKLEALQSELGKVSTEIHKIKSSIVPQAEKTLKDAEAKYNLIVKQISAAQKQLDKEVKKNLGSLKKSALSVEKTLESYKKMAIAQKNSLKKAFSAKSKPKKTNVKKSARIKKVAKKAPPKNKA